MSRQERSMKVYDGKVFGKKVSRYGLENGYLDYMTLSFIVGDCILNNDIFEYAGYENWDLYCGEMEDEDGEYYECNMNLDEDEMVYFLKGQYKNCPYFQSYDEYKIARKQ